MNIWRAIAIGGAWGNALGGPVIAIVGLAVGEQLLVGLGWISFLVGGLILWDASKERTP